MTTFATRLLVAMSLAAVFCGHGKCDDEREARGLTMQDLRSSDPELLLNLRGDYIRALEERVSRLETVLARRDVTGRGDEGKQPLRADQGQESAHAHVARNSADESSSDREADIWRQARDQVRERAERWAGHATGMGSRRDEAGAGDWNARVTKLESIVGEVNITSLAFDLAQLKLLQGDSPFSAGDTAWVIMASSLVLLMTIPGLALFYGGLVRVQNVLSTVMQSFSIACLITVEWMVAGYSLSFTRGGMIYGDHSRMWLTGLTMNSSHPLMPTVPEPIFCMFQLTFAIITPALICGSFADRLKLGPMLVFMAAWHLVVYCPLSHAMWTDVSQSHPLSCLVV